MRLGRCIVLCSAALLATGGSAAASTWTAPRSLVRESNTDPVTLRLALDPRGDGAMVWVHGKLLEARMRSASGRLGPIMTVRRMRFGNNGLPQIAVGPSGQAAIVWLENVHNGAFSRGNVFASVSSGGGFGKPVRIGIQHVWPEGGTGAGAQGDSPKVAVAPDGTVGALWIDDGGALQAAFKRPGHRFSVETIPARSGKYDVGAFDISLAFDGHGTAYAAWSSYNVLDHRNKVVVPAAGVRVAIRTRGASHFAKAIRVSRRGQSVSGLRMAVGGDGTVATIWVDADRYFLEPSPVEAAVKLPNGDFGSPQLLTGHCTGTVPQVAASSGGQVVAAWEQICNPNAQGALPELVGAAAPLGQPFGPAQVFYTPTSDYRLGYLDLAVAGSGDTVAVFSPQVTAAVRPPAGGFEAPQLVATSPYATTPRIAGSNNFVIVAWQAPGGFYYSTLGT